MDWSLFYCSSNNHRISFRQYDYEQISLYCTGISTYFTGAFDRLRPRRKPGQATIDGGYQQIFPITTFTNSLTCNISLRSMVIKQYARRLCDDYHLCQNHEISEACPWRERLGGSTFQKRRSAARSNADQRQWWLCDVYA